MFESGWCCSVCIPFGETEVGERDKYEWAEYYAKQLSALFRKWQESCSINNSCYQQALKCELVGLHDDPLRKALIESIASG